MVLSFPMQNKQDTLKLDGSDREAGRILLQNQNEGKARRPFGYWSLVLIEQKRNLDTTHRNSLVVV